MVIKTNTIYCGDCIEVLKNFPDNVIDLIYIDPPFFTQTFYHDPFGNGYAIKAFQDKWYDKEGRQGDIYCYLDYMEPRIVQIYRVLKKTGSFFLHCDWHANAHLRILLDNIFGEKSFQNEIIWKRTDRIKGTSSVYGKVHDSLLFYTKTEDFHFKVPRSPLDDIQIDRYYSNIEKGTGRKFNHAGMWKLGNEPKTLIFPDKGKIEAPVGKRFVWNQETLDSKLKENPYIVFWTKNNHPRYKIYLDEHEGMPLSDMWNDIPEISTGSSEKMGYPTQKPEALLERIINASSNPMDLVLDPMCGCGTTIAVAHRLGRQWIGIDVSPTACRLMVKRLKSLKCEIKISDIINLPIPTHELKIMDAFEFQKWCIDKLYGRVSPRKSGDMGIDGYSFDGTPIQVKQSAKVGRVPIDKFETAIKRKKTKKGIIIAFSFTRTARNEVARAKREDGLNIELITVKQLLKRAGDTLA